MFLLVRDTLVPIYKANHYNHNSQHRHPKLSGIYKGYRHIPAYFCPLSVEVTICQCVQGGTTFDFLMAVPQER